jgi:hypothetical protein
VPSTNAPPKWNLPCQAFPSANLLATLLVASPLLVKEPSLAVITEDLSGDVGDGGIEMNDVGSGQTAKAGSVFFSKTIAGSS